MIFDLLQRLFSQPLRNCNKSTLREKLQPDFTDSDGQRKPLTIVSVVYPISLVSFFESKYIKVFNFMSQLVDGIVNSFLSELASMSSSAAMKSFLGDLTSDLLESSVEAIKYGFLLNLWEKLEESEVWGPKMRLTRQLWAAAIFD